MDIRRFAHVSLPHEDRWIEIVDGQYILLDITFPRVQNPTHVRNLSSDELAYLTFLPPYSGEKVLGLAYNYASLVGARDSYDEPLFFLKSPTSPCGPNSAIEYPRFADSVWVEVELTIIVGRECRNISPEEADDYILGYTVGSDITAANICARDHHLARSKALDSFAPMGPHLVQGIDTTGLAMTTLINGDTYQSGSTSDMILDARECVSLLSRYVTLKPGDAIMTGTPAGAMSSLVEPGDVVRQEIEGIGVLNYGFVTGSRSALPDIMHRSLLALGASSR